MPRKSVARGPSCLRLPCLHTSCSTDQRRLEGHIEALRAEQKRLTGLLADKGAGPEGAGEGLVRAMLTLRDSSG